MKETAIRRIRKSKGITATFVANQLGIGVSHYWRIETNYRGIKPTVKVIVKLSELFGVPMEALVEVPNAGQLSQTPANEGRA